MHRLALWALVVVLLGSSLATISAAPTPAATTYTLIGFVDQPGGASAPPVPNGVTVELVSAATGSSFSAQTTSGGEFTFTTTSTSGSLAPGYWKLYVQTQTNVSVSGCGQCAILPQDQNPTFAFFNYTELTNKNYSTILPNVAVYPYVATLNGTVYQGGVPTQGVAVKLLAPSINGAVLSNSTTNVNGTFSMNVPYGSWVLQSTHVVGPTTYTNSTPVTVSVRYPPAVSPNLYSLTVSGRVNSTLGRIPTGGNATLYDPANGYIYSTTIPAGGFYSLPTYLANFSHGSQTFDVVLATNGYGTTWFPLTVTSTSAVTRNVVVPTMPSGSMGMYNTTLDFSGINTSTGKGSLAVTSAVTLGNDSVVPSLPNATVGQLWAQLGLDFNHSLSFPSTDANAFKSFLDSQGPAFLATQAGTSVNATTFVAPNASATIASFASSCATFCGLGTGGNVTYGWSQSYTLNGTLAKNSTDYTIGFTFQHPASSSLVYNYAVDLPTGYILSAGTTAPTHAKLTPTGPAGTWGSFVLTSYASTTPSASAKFTIVKSAEVTAIVNVTSSNFTFSSANVLNDSHGNYTVVLGVGENASFSAANSIYNGSANGTKFAWNFGDGHYANVTNESTYHNYTTATGTHNYTGSVTVTTSGGLTGSTTFYVYVENSVPVANLSSNASANQTFSAGGHPYLKIDWNTTLSFSANNSTATPAGIGNLSIASYALVAKNVKKTANFTVANGSNVSANWSVDFAPPKTIGTGPYLTEANVSGTLIPFKGWEYNLTLTVWSTTGAKANTTIAILLNDSQPPTPAFSILNSAGKNVSGSITEAPNGSAVVRLDAASSTDPNNGSIVKYSWNVTNGNNSSLAKPIANRTTASPYPTFTLAAETTPWKINLTVTDANGNTANVTENLTVSPNTTLRPVMTAANLTGSTTLTQGHSTTFWVNVSDTGGSKSTAKNVTVAWYVLPPSGGGSKKTFSATVTFYSYTSPGVPSSTPLAVGVLPTLAYGKTVRAVVSLNPSFTGNWILYANATASNEFQADYKGGSGLASTSIAIKANPTTQLLEYVGVGVAAIVVIGLLVWWYRRPARKPGMAKSSPSRSGLERGSKRPETETTDDKS